MAIYLRVLAGAASGCRFIMAHAAAPTEIDAHLSQPVKAGNRAARARASNRRIQETLSGAGHGC